MYESIVFSSKEADRLNSIVKKSIDSRLFLFAYYSPKTALSDGELGFWKGITNLYGLFIDCAAFLKISENSFLDILKDKKIINEKEYKKIKKVMKVIDAGRGLFSHNNSCLYSKNNYNFSLLKVFLSEALDKELEIDNMEGLILSEDEWKICTRYLVDTVQEIVSLLETSLLVIVNHKEKSIIIEEWSKLIVEWYKKKADDILYNALSNKLSYYLLIRRKTNARRGLYINAWNECYKQKCIESMDLLRNSNKCKEMLPIEFFDSLIETTNPFEFWDDYFMKQNKYL